MADWYDDDHYDGAAVMVTRGRRMWLEKLLDESTEETND